MCSGAFCSVSFFVSVDSSPLSLTRDFVLFILTLLSSFSGEFLSPWYSWHVYAERDREEGERRGPKYREEGEGETRKRKISKTKKNMQEIKKSS